MNIEELVFMVYKQAYDAGYLEGIRSHYDKHSGCWERQTEEAARSLMKAIDFRDEAFQRINDLLAYATETDGLSRDDVIEAIMEFARGEKTWTSLLRDV